MDGVEFNKAAGLVLNEANVLLHLLGFLGDEPLVEGCVGVTGGGRGVFSYISSLVVVVAVVGLGNEGRLGIIVFTSAWLWYLRFRLLLLLLLWCYL